MENKNLVLFTIKEEYGDILSDETMNLITHIASGNEEVARTIYKALEEAYAAAYERGLEEGEGTGWDAHYE